MANDFFRNHRDDIHLYGPQWARSESENVERLATAHCFQKMYCQLKETEKHYRDRGSHAELSSEPPPDCALFHRPPTDLPPTSHRSPPTLSITGCLQMANKSLLKHNYFTDKFDATAWNDGLWNAQGILSCPLSIPKLYGGRWISAIDSPSNRPDRSSRRRPAAKGFCGNGTRGQPPQDEVASEDPQPHLLPGDA